MVLLGCAYKFRGDKLGDFCGIVKPESLKEWLLDKPVRNEAAEELTKFVTPELISAAKQNHTACGYPFLIGYAPAEGGLHEAFCLDPDPVNLASFIVKMGKERGDLMICTPLDTPFLNTFGTFIDRCAYKFRGDKLGEFFGSLIPDRLIQKPFFQAWGEQQGQGHDCRRLHLVCP